MQRTSIFRLTLALTATVAFASACAEKHPIDNGSSILAGLAESQSNDTTGTVPPPPTASTPGSFKGFVLGPGTGPDTMATAPRLQNVAVTVYPYLGWEGNEPRLGEVVATMTTNASGEFQSPTLPGGEYLITFVPPAGSIYRGVYVTTTIHAGSSGGNWWVVLPRN